MIETWRSFIRGLISSIVVALVFAAIISLFVGRSIRPIFLCIFIGLWVIDGIFNLILGLGWWMDKFFKRMHKHEEKE